MNSILKKNAEADTPTTQSFWVNLSNEERLDLVKEKIKENQKYIKISPRSTTEKGQVMVVFTEAIPSNKRGPLLLDFERYLKDMIDQGINVWCEPIGDKNALRNLRGIKIKS